MKYLPILFLLVILAGAQSSCKNPVGPKPGDSTKCDTCDTAHHDTTHVDTTKHPDPSDTSSHSFSWREYNIPTENNLTGCWVFSQDNILALNDHVYRFDGVAWQDAHLKSDKGYELDGLSGFSMFGFSPTDYWLTLGDIVFHSNGTTAHEIRLDSTGAWHYPEDGGLHAAWGTSSSDMFFVGDGGTILHFDGVSWMKFPKVTQERLISVWGTSSMDVWACGFNPHTAGTVLLHFDGTSWKEDPLSAELGIYGVGGFDAVWTCDSAGHAFTATSGAFLKRKTDNGLWRSDSGLLQNKLTSGEFVGLYQLRGNTANDIFTTGDGGFVSHWNGRSWKRFDEWYSPNDLSFVTNSMDYRNQTICLVGRKGSKTWLLVGQQ